MVHKVQSSSNPIPDQPFIIYHVIILLGPTDIYLQSQKWDGIIPENMLFIWNRGIKYNLTLLWVKTFLPIIQLSGTHACD